MNWSKLLVIALVSTSLMACAGKRSPKVVAMKSDDKKLSCQDIKLEINEADFLKDKAEKARGFSAGNLFSPWRYPSTYMNAGKAINSSDERIAYLKRVYNIRGCGTDQEQNPVIAEQQLPTAPPAHQATMQHNFNYQPQQAAPYAAPYGSQPPAYGNYAPQQTFTYPSYPSAPMAPAPSYGMHYQAPYAAPIQQPVAPMGFYGSRTNYVPPMPRGYQSF